MVSLRSPLPVSLPLAGRIPAGAKRKRNRCNAGDEQEKRELFQKALTFPPVEGVMFCQAGQNGPAEKRSAKQ